MMFVRLNAADKKAWSRFQTFKTFCNYSDSLAVCLELKLNKEEDFDPTMIEKWKGENVKLISIDSSTFILNKSGYPVLPK